MFDQLIIIPAYNEAAIIDRSVNLLANFLSTEEKNKNLNWKIVVADNGSNDNTKEKIEGLKQIFDEKIIYFLVTQKGRGHALKETIQNFPSKNYLCIDADIPTEPFAINDLFHPLESNLADISVGFRVGKRPLIRRLLTFTLRAVNRLFLDLKIHDSQCGIKAFNTKGSKILVEKCFENGYFLDTEFLITARRFGLCVEEVKIPWIETRYIERKSKVNIFSDSKKALGALSRIYKKYPKPNPFS